MVYWEAIGHTMPKANKNVKKKWEPPYLYPAEQDHGSVWLFPPIPPPNMITPKNMAAFSILCSITHIP